MLSKKHNDPLYWKNKLEALDCLPVDTNAEKNAMWDKLHGRLQQEPASKKVVWYWLAAALLPLAIITLTMVNKTESILVKKMVENTTHANPVFLLPASKEVVTLSVSAPVEKKQMNTVVKPKTKTAINNDTIKASEVVAVTALLQNQPVEIAVSNTITADTTAAVAVAKKKLPVVHINELETFPAQFNAPVNYAQSIKPSKNKTNGLSMATGQNIIGFKIKLSSKN